MSEAKTYTVVASEPGDPEDSLRAMNEEGEIFLFTGVTVKDIKAAVMDFGEGQEEGEGDEARNLRVHGLREEDLP